MRIPNEARTVFIFFLVSNRIKFFSVAQAMLGVWALKVSAEVSNEEETR